MKEILSSREFTIKEIICDYCGCKGKTRRITEINTCHHCNSVREKTKAFAHYKVHQAVKNGVLPSLMDTDIKCVDCGEIAECYDHRDYAKPLDVDPVCRSCDKLRGRGDNDYNPKYEKKRKVKRVRETYYEEVRKR